MDRYYDLRPIDYALRDLSALWWFYLGWGLLLVAWGIAIVIWPQLLSALVGAIFIMAGFSVFGVAWRVRHLRRDYQRFKREMVGP